MTQIELLGFKSFPHKTVVDLDDGVTCIVGPNGSGKSNIGDAINFAFGSQSGRELRASRLSGLIFAGTEQLRPLNLASVTLHFERTDEELVSMEDSLAGLATLTEEEFEATDVAAASLPVGSQLIEQGGHHGHKLTEFVGRHSTREYDRTPQIIKELTELKPGQRVSLTRRVFRDGTGGYFLNDQPVRLKDIDTLFNRYNLGRSAVYCISQGEVEKKILETPQELREWLAEATGVALLLQQKTRAQNKLKRTRQNLDRLEDIRTNTRELVEDLAGQREKAEEHLRLANELRAVELNEIRREVEFSQRQQESGARALEELREKLTAARKELAEKKGEHEADQARRREAESELERGEGELRRRRERLAQLRQEAAVARRAMVAAEESLRQTAQDSREAAAQLEQAQADQRAGEEESARLAEELAEVRRREGSRQGELNEAQQRMNAVTARQAELANRGFELAQRESSLLNRLEALEQTGRRLDGQLEAGQAQLQEARGRVQAEEAELAEHQRQAEELALEVGNQTDKLNKTKHELSELAERITGAEEGCAVLRDRVAQLNSRRRTIAELADEAEDSENGVARVLADTELAAHLVRVTEVTFPAELRPAFTRLLAHIGDALAGRGADRDRVLKTLAEGGSDLLFAWGNGGGEPHPDSIWRELDAPAEVLSALRCILGDVVVADTPAGADGLLKAHPGLGAVVLRDGSALVGRGYAYLGSPSPERALKVARHSDLAHLDTQVQQVRSELTDAEERLKQLRHDQAKLQWSRDEASSQLAAAEERLRQALKLSDRLHKSIAERRSTLALLERQAGQLQADREKCHADRPAVEAEVAGLRVKREETKAQAGTLEEEREAAAANLEQVRNDHAQAVTRRELAEQRNRHLKQAGLDLAERINNARNRLAQLEQRREQLEATRTENEGLARVAAEAADTLEADLTDAGDSLAGLKQRRVELSKSVEEQQVELTVLSERISRLEQDEVALGGQSERAIEKVTEWLDLLRERYSLTLTQLLADPAITAPPPGAKIDASEAGRGKLREEKARINAALEAIGPVNLLAIEQHQEHSQRLGFLDGQAADLQRALEDLEHLITDLDSSTEKRYRSSLRQIEQRFNEIFLELFGSGWSRLRFEDPEAIIDSGVEVEVQLPGGRRHSLRSLSGGQRSLIFLALFFAVHTVRSPGFCILDEADAALDDANVERFVKLIRRFSHDEQFIVVTHHKHTMETADKLIGVVGKPKGVSNLLAVDIKQARRLVDKTVAQAG